MNEEVVMETLCCPPFCETSCGLPHDKLLLALVNCPDNDLPDEYQQKLQDLIKDKQTENWSLSAPIDDPNPDYRFPVVLWACAIDLQGLSRNALTRWFYQVPTIYGFLGGLLKLKKKHPRVHALVWGLGSASRTSLLYCIKGKPALLQWLVKNGFEIRTQDDETRDNGLHRSILSLPNCCPNRNAVSRFKELLPIMGDCLLLKDSVGATPLHLACEMFTEGKQSVDFYKECALTMFEHALTKGPEFASQVLNSQTENGQTVLHVLASKDSSFKLLKPFVDRGRPNLLLRDSQGMTALGVAISSGQMKTSRFLSHYQNTKMNSSGDSETQNEVEVSKEELNGYDEQLADRVSTTLENANSPLIKMHELPKANSNSSRKRQSTRQALKRKIDEPEEENATNSEENTVSSVDKMDVVECSSRLKKRLKTDPDKDKNNNDDIQEGIERDINGSTTADSGNIKTNQPVEDSVKASGVEIDGQKSKKRSYTNSPSNARRRNKQKVLPGLDCHPTLSPNIKEEKVLVKEEIDECPPVLSPQPRPNIFEAAKIIAKENEKAVKGKLVWSRYIQFCEKNLPKSLPVLLKMTPAQLQEVFAVNPGLREKLGDYLEKLNLDELVQISGTVQNLIAADPLEEILKDLISEQVRENVERERKIKQESSMLIYADDGVKIEDINIESDQVKKRDNIENIEEVKTLEQEGNVDQKKNFDNRVSPDKTENIDQSESAKQLRISNKHQSTEQEESPSKLSCVEPVDQLRNSDHTDLIDKLEETEKIFQNETHDQIVTSDRTESLEKLKIPGQIEQTDEVNNVNQIKSSVPNHLKCQNELDSSDLEKRPEEEGNANQDETMEVDYCSDNLEDAGIQNDTARNIGSRDSENNSLKEKEQEQQNGKDASDQSEIQKTQLTDYCEHARDDNKSAAANVQISSEVINENCESVVSEQDYTVNVEKTTNGDCDSVGKQGSSVSDMETTDAVNEDINSQNLPTETTVPNIIVTDHDQIGTATSQSDADSDFQSSESPGRRKSLRKVSIGKGSDSDGNGLEQYLNFTSTKAVLRNKLFEDKDECQQMQRKSEIILEEIEEEQNKLDKDNKQLDTEIEKHMEEISRRMQEVETLKVKLARNKTLEDDLRGQAEAERLKIESFKTKLETFENALAELDQS